MKKIVIGTIIIELILILVHANTGFGQKIRTQYNAMVIVYNPHLGDAYENKTITDYYKWTEKVDKLLSSRPKERDWRSGI